MPASRADNLRVPALAMMILACVAGSAAGCGEDGATRPGLSNNSSFAHPGAFQGADNPRDAADEANPAEDWLRQGGSERAMTSGESGASPAGARTFSASANADPQQPKKPDQKKSNDKKKDSKKPAANPDQTKPPSSGSDESKKSGDQPAPEDSTYSLVVATFTEGDHAAAAQTMINEMRTIAPQVRGLRVHPTTKGSMVVYGHYKDREDPQAQRDIEWLKSLKYQNRQLFPRVILTHLDLRPLKGERHPYDLLSARKKHPKVDPLYTLDIAVWDDFDSGQVTYGEIRRKAEAYAAQLRQQGFEAYFYHDDANERSLVTVGLFDRTAIHPRSGLYAPNVTALIKKFPQRLVNGEPMFEYANPYQNKRAKDKEHIQLKPQTPVLALVPDL